MLIEVENLTKEFVRYKQAPGLLGTLRSLLARQREIVPAVNDVSFAVAAGEFVGYIGPNGAGKSTTIKMLTGILVPTAGRVQVAGLVPYQHRQENARQIGVVFGQRSQLWWDLPIGETYNLLRHMYGIGTADYGERLHTFRELLGLDAFWDQPVRQLSLGQRMRGELGAALLHRPSILYLDEPTIGMDVLVKERIRQFLLDINRRDGTTILLTTHDLEEVEQTCSRLLLINQGRLLYDGSVQTLRAGCAAQSRLVVDFYEVPPAEAISRYRIVQQEGNRLVFGFRRQELGVQELIADLIGHYAVRDLSIQEPTIDNVVRDLYASDAHLAEA